MKTETIAHQGKWGWYPCDRETYLKLKKINKAYEEGLRQRAAWCRWAAKLPHNRVIRRWKRNEKGQRIGCEIVGPAPEPKMNALMTEIQKNPYAYLDASRKVIDITAEYRKTRMPAASQESVQSLSLTPEQIESLLRETES